MTSAQFVVGVELDLKELKDGNYSKFGLYSHTVHRHGLHLSWFKPWVGMNVKRVRCGPHWLWSTTSVGHELHELLVLVKCASKEEGGFHAGFAVLSEFNYKGGLEHHYYELGKDGEVREENDLDKFVSALFTALENLNAVDALDPPYPEVPFHFFFRRLEMVYDKMRAAHTDAPASGQA